MSDKKNYSKEITTNRKAFHEYEILERFEVGIALVGTEVKSVRSQGASLQEAYISCEGSGLSLINASIPPYTHGNIHNHEEKRKRPLLASRREISKIREAITEKGMTCIPIKLYIKNSLIKLEIAIGRGKKLYDKREDIKAREDKREISRALKSNLKNF